MQTNQMKLIFGFAGEEVPQLHIDMLIPERKNGWKELKDLRDWND